MSPARPRTGARAPAGAGAQARIHVEIGELVLHGFPAAGRDALGDALRAELAASLVGWSGGRGAAVAHLDGGTIRVAHDASPASVGRALAHAVRQALPCGPAGRPGSAGGR